MLTAWKCTGHLDILIISKFSGASSVPKDDTNGTEGEGTSLSEDTNIVIKTESLDLPVESLSHHPQDRFQANLPSHSSYEPTHLVKEETTIPEIDLRSDSNFEISVKPEEYSPSPPRVVIERDSTPEIVIERDSTPEIASERDTTTEMLPETSRIKTKPRIKMEPRTILEALQWTDSESSDSESDQDSWNEKEDEKKKFEEEKNIKPDGEEHDDAYGSVSEIPEMISSEPVLEHNINDNDRLDDHDRAEEDNANINASLDNKISTDMQTSGTKPKAVKICYHCDKIFKNNRAYAQHVSNHIVKCQFCGKTDTGKNMR